MKLDIGSGERPHRGFTTVDIEEYAHPDYLGDFRVMQFSEIECIRAHHILEHFSRKESINVLKLWHSWLQTGGILIVETPDFEKICENWKVNPEWMTRHTYGSQESEWAFHKDGWWENKFKDILPRIGFRVIEVKRNKSRVILPNIVVTAIKI